MKTTLITAALLLAVSTGKAQEQRNNQNQTGTTPTSQKTANPANVESPGTAQPTWEKTKNPNYRETPVTKEEIITTERVKNPNP